jgi:hypothetical protein
MATVLPQLAQAAIGCEDRLIGGRCGLWPIGTSQWGQNLAPTASALPQPAQMVISCEGCDGCDGCGGHEGWDDRGGCDCCGGRLIGIRSGPCPVGASDPQ